MVIDKSGTAAYFAPFLYTKKPNFRKEAIDEYKDSNLVPNTKSLEAKTRAVERAIADLSE